MTTPNGLLLIDKHGGVTSHDVVAIARRSLRERRIGHAGTLDPMATGLLVLAVGPSTRLLRFAQGQTKVYTGTVRFGVATDSLDADGVVTATAPVGDLDEGIIAQACAALSGPQMQIPPMVSAIKVGGKRLHELARAGVEVERAPRAITIEHFTLTPTEQPDVWDFVVRCSVGTYVRVLLSDLAQRLGTLGHLIALRRESSGDHHVADALTTAQLEELVHEGGSPLAPPLHFVSHLMQVSLDAEGLAKLRKGQLLDLDCNETSEEVAVLDERGNLAGIVTSRGSQWQPTLVLPEEGA
jgi:tRNA pseudouridine55 synthase